MQYLLRFILASYVVLYHTGNAYFVNSGTIAVFGFYTLSGYIITRVLQDVYFQKTSPARDFFQNRFWRLYPCYFACISFGFIVAYAFPDIANDWNTAIVVPDLDSPFFSESGIGWLIPNLSIMGLHLGVGESSPIRYAPPSWTTAIEIYFYIFLFFIGARSEKICRNWLIVSCMLLAGFVFLLLSEASFWTYSASDTIYSNVFAISTCFSLGSYVYFLQKNNPTGSLHLGYAAFVGAIVLPLIPFKSLNITDVAFQVLKYIECILVAVFLYGASEKSLGRFVTFLGDLSYPIFLAHWQVAILLTAIGLPIIKQDIGSMISIWMATIAVSVILVFLVEKPILKVRKRIRQRA